ncbi:MAG TPA: MFS transporter [Candidatus Baltobacteraceae bacterium]
MTVNRPYAVLLGATIVLEFACNLPTGSMPLALHDDGTVDSAIALAMGAGMFANLFGSIPVGVLVDRIGRLVTIRASALLMAFATLGMALTHGPLFGGLFMALRGLSLMSYVTAEFAYTTEIVPAARAVSYVSFLGLIANVMFAFAPAVGVWLWLHNVQRDQYYIGTALALAGTAALWLLPSRHDVKTAKPSRTILMRSLWLPTIAFLVASAVQSGVNFSIAVLTFYQRGIGNAAIIFMAMALATAAVRYPAGRIADKRGPRSMLIPIVIAQIVGCLLAAHATTTWEVIAAGTALGIAWGAIVPVGVALFFEQSGRRTRGAAMGAYNLSFSLGSALGAGLAAAFVHFGFGYGGAMLVCTALPLLTLPFVLTARRRSPR